MSHQCPRPPCDRQVDDDQLACHRHWYELPKELRDRIWRAWRQDPRGAEHAAAITEAVDWYRVKRQGELDAETR